MTTREQLQDTLCYRLFWHTAEALGKQTTWQMFRRKLKALNRNKLIVFVDQHFGIFPSHEVLMLANVPFQDIAKELNITREHICAKYTDVPVTEKS